MTRSNSDVQLQSRDVEVFCGLLESRVLTLKHISALYFDGQAEMAKKRMRKLAVAGYLKSRPRTANDPLLLTITRKAFDVIRERGRLENYPHMSWPAHEKRLQVSPITLQHELAVQDVRTTIIRGAKKSGEVEVVEFKTWPAMYQFKTPHSRQSEFRRRKVLVKPDGFFRLRNTKSEKEDVFFLEVDRSTESLDILMRKIECYLQYYRSGDFAVRNGGSRERYKKYPFRVLIILQSRERADYISQRLRLEIRPLRGLVGLATLHETLTTSFLSLNLFSQNETMGEI